METLFYVSNGALWLLFLVQSVLLVLLYRHIGTVMMGSGEGHLRDGLQVGEAAPPVSLVTAEGQGVLWAPQAGRPQLLVFAAPDCEPCAEVFPYINRLATAPDGHRVPATAIVQGGSGYAARAAEKLGSSVPFLAEDGSGAFDLYQVRITPFAFVIGADGRVQAKGPCGLWAALKRVLEAGGLNDSADELEFGIQPVRHDRGVAVAERSASS